MYVKVCGVGTRADLAACARAGADAVGLVLSRRSVRGLAIDRAAALAGYAAELGLRSVVVVDDLSAKSAVAVTRQIGADVLQLHGRHSRDEVRSAAVKVALWLALPGEVLETGPLDVGEEGEELVVLDSRRPGSGTQWDTALLREHPVSGRWLLAGGLDPSNVADAVNEAQPWGVDVSSGVEATPGMKDHSLIARFVECARFGTSGFGR